MEIPELRDEIDRIDAQMLALLDRRLELAIEIGRAKRAKGRPLLDSEREAAMLASARATAHQTLKPHEAEDFLATLLQQTRGWVTMRAKAEGLAPRRIAIIGLGLIGGSLAKALKRAQPGHTLVGIDVAARLEGPRASGLFETLASGDAAADAVRHVEFAFVCTPLSHTLTLLPTLADDLPKGCVVSDVAGLKAPVAAVADGLFAAPDAAYFVGGHPMAGKAVAGFENSSSDLFQNRPWILTPQQRDPVDLLNSLKGLIDSTGAHVQILTPAEHDRMMAFASHLPQLLATSLMLTVAGRDRGVAGPALMEMTRLAASSAAMWNELSGRLSPELISEIQRMRAYLTELEIAVTFGEPMDKWFNRANTLRSELEQRARAND
jgi:prephenate dehydrogenase/chorismate mutase